MTIIDGIDLLNGCVSRAIALPHVCINADFEVVAWVPGEGLRSVGHGRDLEGAQAIACLYSGHANHYIDFTEGVHLKLLMLESKKLSARMG